MTFLDELQELMKGGSRAFGLSDVSAGQSPEEQLLSQRASASGNPDLAREYSRQGGPLPEILSPEPQQLGPFTVTQGSSDPYSARPGSLGYANLLTGGGPGSQIARPESIKDYRITPSGFTSGGGSLQGFSIPQLQRVDEELSQELTALEQQQSLYNSIGREKISDYMSKYKALGEYSLSGTKNPMLNEKAYLREAMRMSQKLRSDNLDKFKMSGQPNALVDLPDGEMFAITDDQGQYSRIMYKNPIRHETVDYMYTQAGPHEEGKWIKKQNDDTFEDLKLMKRRVEHNVDSMLERERARVEARGESFNPSYKETQELRDSLWDEEVDVWRKDQKGLREAAESLYLGKGEGISASDKHEQRLQAKEAPLRAKIDETVGIQKAFSELIAQQEGEERERKILEAGPVDPDVEMATQKGRLTEHLAGRKVKLNEVREGWKAMPKTAGRKKTLSQLTRYSNALNSHGKEIDKATDDTALMKVMLKRYDLYPALSEAVQNHIKARSGNLGLQDIADAPEGAAFKYEGKMYFKVTVNGRLKVFEIEGKFQAPGFDVKGALTKLQGKRPEAATALPP